MKFGSEKIAKMHENACCTAEYQLCLRHAAMNAKELVDELFALDREIRWVGIVDQRM